MSSNTNAATISDEAAASSSLLPPASPSLSASRSSMSHRSSSTYASLKNRRRERDRAQVASFGSPLLAAAHQLAMSTLGSTKREIVHEWGELIAGKVALSLNVDLGRVKEFIQSPEVSCIIFEFFSQSHASWNPHHQAHLQSPTHQAGNTSSGLSSPRMAPAAPSGRTGEEKEHLSPLSPARTPSLGRPNPFGDDFSLSSPARASTSSVASLTDQLPPPETEMTWALPQRLLFWRGKIGKVTNANPALHSTTSGFTSGLASPTDGGRTPGTRSGWASPSGDEVRRTHAAMQAQIAANAAAVQANELLAPSNALAAHLGKEAHLIEPGVLVSLDFSELRLYTGTDLSVVGSGNHVANFTRLPTFLHQQQHTSQISSTPAAASTLAKPEIGTRSESKEADESAAAIELPSFHQVWKEVVTTVGILGSQTNPSTITSPTAASGSSTSSTAGTHTQLFHTMHQLIGQIYLPAIQQQEEAKDHSTYSATSTAQSSSSAANKRNLLVGTGGSGISAAKALRSSSSNASAASMAASAASATATSLAPLTSFVDVLRDACHALENLVVLRGPEKPYELHTLQLDEGQIYALCAQRQRIVHYESTLTRWCNQIQNVFQVTNQLRQGSLTATGGPSSELEFWKSRMSIFDDLVAQFSKFHVQSVLLVLSTYKSRHSARWQNLVKECESMMLESHDNVKYLSALNSLCNSLYHGTPEDISQALPQIINSVGLLYTLAKFYHTSEHLTSLFVKITNQIIETCIKFLDASTIWKRNRWSVVKDLSAVIQLYHTYKTCYNSTKEKLQRENPLGPQFDFSDAAIFGNLTKFIGRICKIKEMMLTLLQFSNLTLGRESNAASASNSSGVPVPAVTFAPSVNDSSVESEGESVEEEDEESTGAFESAAERSAPVTKKIEGLGVIITQYELLEAEMSKRGSMALPSLNSPTAAAAIVSPRSDSGAIDLFTRTQTDYNLFDYNSSAFDDDYYRFHRKILALEEALIVFIHLSFSRGAADPAAASSAADVAAGAHAMMYNLQSNYTERALEMLANFNQIFNNNLPATARPAASNDPSSPSASLEESDFNLSSIGSRENILTELHKKYSLIFHNYTRDLLEIKAHYETFKANPPVAKNITPIAGAINWSRQLLRKIQTPMKIIMKEKIYEYENNWQFMSAAAEKAKETALQANPAASTSSSTITSPIARPRTIGVESTGVNVSSPPLGAVNTASTTSVKASISTGGPNATKVIKIYNSLVNALIQYEHVWHKSWLDGVMLSSSLLKSTLLVQKAPNGGFGGSIADSNSNLLGTNSSVSLTVRGATLSPPVTALPPPDPEADRRNVLSTIPLLAINFDQNIFVLIRESKFLYKMGLFIPDEIKYTLLAQEARLKSQYHELSFFLQEYHGILFSKISTVYERIFLVRMQKLWNLILPLLTTLTWSSMNIVDYLKTVMDELYKMENLLNQANDILSLRIIGGLNWISNTELITLPNSLISIDHFYSQSENQVKQLTPIVNAKSYSIEYASYELLDILCEGYSRIEKRSVKHEKKQLIEQIHSLQFNAIAQMIENNLRKLKEKFVSGFNQRQQDVQIGPGSGAGTAFDFSPSSVADGTSSAGAPLSPRSLNLGAAMGDAFLRPPVFGVDIELSIPDIKMVPSLDEIQECMNRTAKIILSAAAGIVVPGQVRTSHEGPGGITAVSAGAHSSSALETYYYAIGKNRRIIKIVFQLTGTFAGLRKKVDSYLKKFLSYSFLWKEDKRETIAAFLNTSPPPSIEDFEKQIERYNGYHNEINHILPIHIIESLSLSSKSLKSALSNEILTWKNLFGYHLNAYAQRSCTELSNTLNQHIITLQKPVESMQELMSITRIMHHLRADENQFDLQLLPIVEAYAILKKYGVRVATEEKVSVKKTQDKRVELKNLLLLTSHNLLKLQPIFRDRFIGLLREFKTEIKEFEKSYNSQGPFVPGIPPRVSVERLDFFQKEYDAKMQKWRFYQELEVLFFGVKYQGHMTKAPFLIKMGREMHLGQQLYGLFIEITKFYNAFKETLWTLIPFSSGPGISSSANAAASAEKANAVASTATTSSSSSSSGVGNVTNLASIDKEMAKFAQRCSILPRGIKDWPAYREIKQMLNVWNESMPLLSKLTSHAIKPRHWDQLFQFFDDNLRSTIHSIDELRIGHLLTPTFLSHKEEIEELTYHATKENEIEMKFLTIQDAWVDEVFIFEKNWHGKENIILDSKHSVYLAAKCSETQLLLNSLMNSRYNSFFKIDLLEWVKKLAKVDEIMEEWLVVQNLFMYICTVFSSGDVARQLPSEAKRFASIDKSWCKAMYGVYSSPNVLYVCYKDETLTHLLPWMRENLEMCQKYLSGYLEQKRMIFPRFYFISDPVLLEILGKGSSEPNSIQPHLYSIFDNINRIELNEEAAGGSHHHHPQAHHSAHGSATPSAASSGNNAHNKNLTQHIVSMISAESEKVRLRESIPCIGNIESWLTKLEHESHETIRRIALLALNQFESLPMTEFIKRFPAQLVLLVYQIIWTRHSEEGIRASKNDRNAMLQQFKGMVDLFKGFVTLTNNNKLSELARQTVETLITVQVHQRDVYEKLIKTKIKTVSDFEWLKQTRFYWVWEKSQCQISITDVDFIYANEYMGSAGRLVITPLTDRAYVTLAQSLGLGLGGSPVGPAGTGKTETVKDMGRTLGKFVVVFNCSDQMDYIQLGKIFKGVAQSGVWSDFDEFNRIKLEVLSVVAQQISSILTAIREYKDKTTFPDGTVIKVDPTAGIFITMNPTYAGRQELPENLKALFRNVSMMVPERMMIIQVRLAASGFHRNALLAKKFTLLYHLCEQQLSKQRHYDFGLRNILSVLRVLGPAKRKESAADLTEEEIFLTVVRDMNVSKLIDSDEVLFLALLDDVFPVKPGSSNSASNRKSAEVLEFESHVNQFCVERNLVPHPSWTRKISELSQLLAVRHGLMILGPSCSGKTAALEALRYVLGQIDCPRSVRRMNPKAITASQMFGRLEETTQDWTEGIFSELWRQACASNAQQSASGQPLDKPWIVLDGPVDTLWIENLNSVLDDSRVLTLANGDRLSMSKDLRLIFEVENLANASPATVSRAGIVYMSSTTLSWQAVFQAWINKRTRKPTPKVASENNGQPVPVIVEEPQVERARLLPHEFTPEATELEPSDGALLSSLFHRHLPATLSWLRDSGVGASQVMKLQDVNRVQSILNNLEGLLALRVPVTKKEREEEEAEEEEMRLAAEKELTKKNRKGSVMRTPLASPLASPNSTAGSATLPAISPPLSPAPSTALSSNVPASKLAFRAARHLALERIFVFSFAWGMGGLLPPTERVKFHEFMKAELKLKLPHSTVSARGRPIVTDVPPPPSRARAPAAQAAPSGETVFDFFLDSDFRWNVWSHMVTRWSYLTRLAHFRRLRLTDEEAQGGDKYIGSQQSATKASKAFDADFALDEEDEEEEDAANATKKVLSKEEEEELRFDTQSGELDFEFPTFLSRWMNSPELSPLVASKIMVPDYSTIFIPTIDSVRAEYNMLLVAKQARKNLLIVGEMGSAKSVTAHRFIEMLCSGDIGRQTYKAISTPTSSKHLPSAESFLPAIPTSSKFLNFSSATTPEIFQTTLESCLVKRIGNSYGPPMPTISNESTTASDKAKDAAAAASGVSASATTSPSQLMLFIDDLNMPQINAWGDQVTNEIVRQVIEYKDVYSLSKPGEKHQIQDVNIMAAMTLPYGGRNDIPSRLKGRFHILYLTPPSRESLDVIYTSIVQAYFNSEHGFNSMELVNLTRSLPRLSRMVWKSIQKQLLPTPAKFHYIFNIRDLSKIFEGIVVNANPALITNEAILMNLWQCETSRVLCDKLIQEQDVKYVSKEMRDAMSVTLPDSLWSNAAFQKELWSPFAVTTAANLSVGFGSASFNASTNEDKAPKYFVHFLHGLDHTDEDEAATAETTENGDGIQSPRAGAAPALSMADLAKEQEESSKSSLTASRNALLKLSTYEPAPPLSQLRVLLQSYLDRYNAQARVTPMNLVFFADAVAHLLRICRVLNTRNRGHAMLVGVGGCGKQSLTRLAAYITNTKLVTPNLANNLGEFLEVIKGLYVETGVRAVPTTFLLTDADIKDESTYLEYINMILTSGEIAGLFSREEVTNLMYELRANVERETELREREISLLESQAQEAAQQSSSSHFGSHHGHSMSTDGSMAPVIPPAAAAPQSNSTSNSATNIDYYKEFLTRVRANLHVILCFSPLHPRFRMRSLQFPGVISGVIDWFLPWTHEALVAVSEKFLADVQVPVLAANAPPTAKPTYEAMTVTLRSNMAQYMARVHEVTEDAANEYLEKFKRQIYQTPKSFISFVHGFKGLYAAKLAELQTQYGRLTGGLSKLIQAEKDIQALELVLNSRQTELALASRQLETLMDEITANKSLATKKSNEMKIVRNNMLEAAQAIERDRQEAEDDLKAAIPLMEAAQKALETISQKDINLLRALLKPHNLIERVFDAILILNRRGVRPIEMDDRYGSSSSSASSSSSSQKAGKNFPRYQTSWQNSVVMLRDKHFLDLLLNFPKDALDDETIELLTPYLRQMDFNVEGATQVSSWVAGLTTWVQSMKSYWEIFKFVQPKKIKLDQQRELVELAEAKLSAAEKEMAEKQAELEVITAKFEESIASKQELEKDLSSTLSRITSARALLAGLASEQARWTSEARSHAATLASTLGHCGLSQSFLSYAGNFNQEFRIKLWKNWMREMELVNDRLRLAAGSIPTGSPQGRRSVFGAGMARTPGAPMAAGSAGSAAFALTANQQADQVPFESDLNLCYYLSSANEIGEWTSLQGLPVDRHSVENGVILTRSSRFPLLIDPQGQGKNWLMQKYSVTLAVQNNIVASSGNKDASIAALSKASTRDLVVCSASDPSFRTKLENALEHGKVFLLADLTETVPTILSNILDKVLMKRGKKHFVSLAGVDVDYHPDFYLFMTTKYPNPHYSPEISASALLIDFTVTHQGLESQLLERVILVERKELEEQRVQLVKNIQIYRNASLLLEDDLLQRLSGHQGDLLNDLGLIEVLNQTKKTSEEMMEKIASAQTTEKAINAAREEYRPIAIRGSILFFLTADMSKVNHMYQTSLLQFLQMFDEGMFLAEKNPGLLVRRVKSVVESITFAVFRHVVCGLFKTDTQMFQLLLALKVDLQRGAIKQHEFELLIKGPKLTPANAGSDAGSALSSPTNASARMPNRFARWMTPEMWSGVVALLDMPFFRNLILASLERHESYWSQWLNLEQPEQTKVPDLQLDEKMDAFQRLMLIRCLRPDRTMLAAYKYIANSIGDRFISPPPLALDDIIRETNPQTPIVFLLSTGADPSQSIKEVALKWNTELHVVSMGQGQEVRARSMVQKLAIEAGSGTSGWLLLQNSHLSLDFITELQTTLAKLEVTESNKDFRLWITTQPTPEFPIVFLQNSVKLTSEPPQGMKHGLARQYGSLAQSMLEAVDRQEWQPLLYAICFLHCAVIERRKFGPIGWQHAYEFNSSDLHASVEFAKKYLYSEDVRKPLKWETIRYMICDIMYGGRIIDDWDRLLMNALGEQWITRELALPAAEQALLGDSVPPFQFATGYPLPKNLTKVEEYMNFIETLPLVDPPELLGLASNADLIYRNAEANLICRTIWSIQPKEGASHGDEDGDSATGSSTAASSRETQLNERIAAILAEWPPEFDMIKVDQQIAKLEAAILREKQENQLLPSGESLAAGADSSSTSPEGADSPATSSTPAGPVNPLNVCLRQEVDRMQIVIRAVRKHLTDVQLALAGSIMLTSELESVLESLYLDTVPLSWESLTWVNKNGTLTTWLIDMFQIVAQLTSWLKHGAPKVFSLPSFFNPQGFLTAIKQIVARANRQWAMEDLELVASVTKFDKKESVKSKAEDGGIYISGLYLDGASWDGKRQRLVESVGSSTVRAALPVVHVTARSVLNSNPFGHLCPVYRLTARTDTNFIMSINLPTDIRSAHWTRRGVAIICSPT